MGPFLKLRQNSKINIKKFLILFPITPLRKKFGSSTTSMSMVPTLFFLEAGALCTSRISNLEVSNSDGSSLMRKNGEQSTESSG